MIITISGSGAAPWLQGAIASLGGSLVALAYYYDYDYDCDYDDDY